MSEQHTSIRGAEPDFFRKVIETYGDKVIRLCYGFVHDENDAQDLAQDVFLEVFRSLKNFREESAIATWIYRIAVNKSLNFIRSRKRRSFVVRFGQVFGNSGRELEIAGDETQEAGDAGEESQALYQAMDSLPEKQRIALTLHKYDQLPHREIARIMGTSVSSVESLIHRAMENLRKKLVKIYR